MNLIFPNPEKRGLISSVFSFPELPLLLCKGSAKNYGTCFLRFSLFCSPPPPLLDLLLPAFLWPFSYLILTPSSVRKAPWRARWNQITPVLSGLAASHYSSAFLEGEIKYTVVLCAYQSFGHVRLFVTPWTVAHQAPLSMGFLRQNYWSGWPFPSPGNLPNPGTEPGSSAFQADSSPSWPPGNPQLSWVGPNQDTATTVFIIILLVICQIKNKSSTYTWNQYNAINQLYVNKNLKKQIKLDKANLHKRSSFFSLCIKKPRFIFFHCTLFLTPASLL